MELPKKVRKSDIFSWDNELHISIHKIQYPIYAFLDDRELVRIAIRRVAPKDIAYQRDKANRSGLIGMWTSPRTQHERDHNNRFLS